MMNKRTRRLSKIPEAVKGEIESYFVNSNPIMEDNNRKLSKLDDNTADYIRTGLTVCQVCLQFFVLCYLRFFCTSHSLDVVL